MCVLRMYVHVYTFTGCLVHARHSAKCFVCIISLIFTSTTLGKNYFLHFTYEETESRLWPHLVMELLNCISN